LRKEREAEAAKRKKEQEELAKEANAKM